MVKTPSGKTQVLDHGDANGHGATLRPTCGEASNSRKLTMLLLAFLPIPFLFGLVLNKPKFVLQETKAKGMSTTSSTSVFYSNRTHRKTASNLRPFLVEGATQFVKSRNEAYLADGEKVKPDQWKMRGHGWLFTYQNMILAAQVVDSQGTPNQLAMGQNKIQIFDVHPDSQNRQDCHLLTIWVRLNGPEIFSGKPKVVQDVSSCHWEFPIDIQVPGTYHLDAKVVFWNGRAPVVFYEGRDTNEQTQCKVTYNGNILPDTQFQQAPQKTNLVGFKMYSPLMSCCETCRRYAGCLYFATPPKIMPHPQKNSNGCELYYSKDTNASEVPESRILDWTIEQQNIQIQQAADAEAQKAALEAATAQAAADAKAQEEANAAAQAAADAAAAAAVATTTHVDPEQSARTLVLAAMAENNNTHPTTHLRQRRRQRRLQDIVQGWGSPYSDNPELAYFVGCGWSFMFTLEQPCLSGDLDDLIFTEQSDFEVTTTSPQEEEEVVAAHSSPLPLCTLDDESMLPKVPAGKGRWVREPWPEDCPPYQAAGGLYGALLVPTPDRPHCWWRTDMTPINKNCFEINCPLIQPHSQWNSTALQHEKQFYAVWRNYQCDYLLFTDAQLNQCFQTKKIRAIKLEGASIGNVLTDYMGRRTESLQFYDNAAGDGKTVIVSSVTWPHLLWRGSEDYWRFKLEETPPQEEAYWVSPMFISSEREPYVQVDRGLQLLEIAEPILRAKGYHMINMFDPSAAMTYDTSAQRDGLHIVGPPFKYAINRVFHHMCAGVVDGTIA